MERGPTCGCQLPLPPPRRNVKGRSGEQSRSSFGLSLLPETLQIFPNGLHAQRHRRIDSSRPTNRCQQIDRIAAWNADGFLKQHIAVDAPQLGFSRGNDASEQHVDASCFMKHAAARGDHHATWRERYQHFARLRRAIRRCRARGNVDATYHGEASCRDLDADALFRSACIGSVERALSGAQVDIDTHLGLCFRCGGRERKDEWSILRPRPRRHRNDDQDTPRHTSHSMVHPISSAMTRYLPHRIYFDPNCICRAWAAMPRTMIFSEVASLHLALDDHAPLAPGSFTDSRATSTCIVGRSQPRFASVVRLLPNRHHAPPVRNRSP